MENKIAWIKSRKKYNFELKKTRSNFYNNKISECDNNPKQLYGILGKLTGENQEKVLPTENDESTTANQMTQFYVEKKDKI